MTFTHLHVASGYSLRHGASTPYQLAEAAAAHGMPALALTDRDGLYGAVKFAQACGEKGIAPLIGVDLAVEPTGLLDGLGARRGSGRAGPGGAGRGASGGGAWRLEGAPGSGAAPRRNPVRGGASVDPRHPRVTVLALGSTPATGLADGAGWAALCRLVTATHLRGERGTPVSTAGLVAAHAAGVAAVPRTAPLEPGPEFPGGAPPAPAGELPALAVLLGPASELGRAVLARRPDVARAVLERWRAALPPGALFVEVVHHRGPQGMPASLGHAVRMLQLARELKVPAVLTNAVRHAEPDGAVTVDVLDAARRLVALDSRHLDRTTAEGYLAPPAEMAARAAEITEAAGEGRGGAGRLLAETEALAARAHLDGGRDLGLGGFRLPEPEAIGLTAADDALAILRARCADRIPARYGARDERAAFARLDEELETIGAINIPTYFLTVARVCELIRGMGVRVAARGSGAGSMVNHLLGISGVDPLRHGLLMERFLTTLRPQLPDIDLDVESARRTEVYERILDVFGGERVTCVSMMDTYRVRHAIRDVGAALGLPPGEIGTIATSFPHIRARDVRHALAELPELGASGLASSRLDLLFDLVERLDGLPRHVALHPCGVVLSDVSLLDRTPVEASWMGFPMSQFDKDDVESLGLLKLDVLGIRMQSAMAYAIDEVERVEQTERIDLDAVPFDDETTFRMIRTAHTLGCFQIESPGQRELIGKFGPETFEDLIVDISLFRPGPVKSDMITPFLHARQGWIEAEYIDDRLRGALAETHGVVVFHEQVLKIVSETMGCDLAHAEEIRRALGSPKGQEDAEPHFRRFARGNGFGEAAIDRIWAVLKAFASFGFCKAHAAAFAVPTYHSAWLKAHHPAAFLAGVLTHDPGMYPKRLILDDARNLGVAVLPLDVNASESGYRVERLAPGDLIEDVEHPGPGLPDGRGYGIRLALADVKGISAAEVARITGGRPYASLADFWHRAEVSRPVVERLVLAGAFDTLYALGGTVPVRRRDRITRRDLLLQLGELERWTRSGRSQRSGRAARRDRAAADPAVAADRAAADRAVVHPAALAAAATAAGEGGLDGEAVRRAAARQSRAARPVPEGEQPVQLALDLGDAPDETVLSGLPEMTGAERTRAELEVLGLDASRHVLDFYLPMVEALGVTRAKDLLTRRSRAELLVAGVKVATQTPPIRSGRRVVFLTLDDATGPIDATFFEDVQGPFAATVFHSWLLVVRGELRRTGPRGVSLRATGAWELPALWDVWTAEGTEAVRALLEEDPAAVRRHSEAAVAGAAASRDVRPVPARPPAAAFGGGFVVTAEHEAEHEASQDAATGMPAGDRRRDRAGGMGGGAAHRRVLVHASGFKQSPYADLKPPGEDTKDTRRMAAAEDTAAEDSEARRRREPPRKVWHASPGSSGR